MCKYINNIYTYIYIYSSTRGLSCGGRGEQLGTWAHYRATSKPPVSRRVFTANFFPSSS